MAKKFQQIDERLIYLSLLIIIVLGIIINLTREEIYSVVALLTLILVALGNIGYLYTRLKS